MELSHLANPLATSLQLGASASQLDGIPKDLEDSIRFETVRLLQAAGTLLRLPQELIAQSIIIFYRYWTGTDGGSLLEHDSKVCIQSVSSCID
jgi:cyclin L